MSADRLQDRTKKELIRIAKKHGIPRSESLTKSQLIKAIHKANQLPKKSATVSLNGRKSKPAAKIERSMKSAAKRKHPVKFRKQRSAARDTQDEGESPEQIVERSKFDVGVPTKDLSKRLPRDLPTSYGRDRVVVMVRDPYWLHCYWELTRASVQRAEVALGQEWHGAKPILRLLDVSSEDTTSAAEATIRDIDIHGGCNNWYVDVPQPPRSYRIDVGYLTKSGRFYVLARSNVVTTPRAGVSDRIDENWTDIQQQYEKIYAMSGGYDTGASSLELKQLFEERLRRPMGSAAITSFGSGAFQGGKPRKFWFQLDAELIVYGATDPNAKVTLQGEPIQLRPDGTFTMRFSLPDSRQIIPAVATSADGVEERTIVLAVERNTKELEPMIHDGSEQ